MKLHKSDKFTYYKITYSILLNPKERLLLHYNLKNKSQIAKTLTNHNWL